MSDQAIRDRLSAEQQREQDAGELHWYFFVFVGDTGFLAAAFVQAFGPVDAVRQADLKKLNPGGTALIVSLPDGMPPPPKKWCNKLLSLADLELLGLDSATLEELIQKRTTAPRLDHLVSNQEGK